MDEYTKKFLLKDLDQLSIDNLKCGRFTATAISFAFSRFVGFCQGFDRADLGGPLGGSASDRVLADMLNDMLESARYLKRMEECPECGENGHHTHTDERCVGKGSKNAYVIVDGYSLIYRFPICMDTGIPESELRKMVTTEIEHNGLKNAEHISNVCPLPRAEDCIHIDSKTVKTKGNVGDPGGHKEIDMDDLARADWPQLEEDVTARIHLLAGMAALHAKSALMDKIANDLILPNLRLLAQFCENIEIKDIYKEK